MALDKKKAGGSASHSDPFAPVEPPLAPVPVTQRLETRPSTGRRRAKQQALDPDVAAFGAIFESTKLYVYMGLYLACQAAIYVLIKGSLATMKTPGLMSFLHLTSASLSFWLSSAYDIFDTKPVSENWAQAVRGASVRAVLFGLQMLTLYGALLHSSVNMILSWAATAPLLIDAALALATGKRSRLLSPAIIPLLAVAGLATAFEVVIDGVRSWLSLLMLLLWSGTKAAETCWRLLKEDPSLGGRLRGEVGRGRGAGVENMDFGALASTVRRLAEAEASLNAPSTALLVNALPALPVLCLGFVGQEVNEIIDHELSVPAVQLMLLSMVAHVGITWCQLLLHERLSGTARATLRWGALIGAIAFNFAERTAGATIATAACALVAVGASAGASLQRHMEAAAGARRRRAVEGAAAAAAGGGDGAIDEDDDQDDDEAV